MGPFEILSSYRLNQGSYGSNSPKVKAQYEQNLKQTGAFLTFIVTLGCCIAYYVTFKTYHLHLQKADSLKAILENPNARVASGAQGKRVMKRLGMAVP